MKRVLRSIYGQYVGTVDDFRVMCQQGLITGPWGNQMPLPDTNNFVTFDDFPGATLDQVWQVNKGTDGAAANFACNGGISGTILGTTGATTTTMAGSGIQVASHLNYKAQGAGGATAPNNLEFNARVQLSAATNLVIFVGLTNQVAALQMPIQGSGVGNAFTGNANDAVGFVYDTTMTNPFWYAIGNKATVLAAGQSSAKVPVANVYDQLAFSVDQLGNATFFMNGLQFGVTMPNAVTPTVALTPVIAAFNRTAAASRNVVADYVMSSMNRI